MTFTIKNYLKLFTYAICFIQVHTGYSVNYLFAHGIADSHEQALKYTVADKNGNANKYSLIPGTVVTFDFPDSTKRFWRINFTKSSLGQANELMTLYKAHKKLEAHIRHTKQDPDIVLYGLSRGASTIINYMGNFNTQNVKALILESPFDSFKNLVDNHKIVKKLSFIPGFKSVINSMIGYCFMQYRKNGLQPIDCVAGIDKNIPVLFVCSEKDTVVPAERTKALYTKLKENGHKKTHLLVIPDGKHAKFLESDHAQLYAATLHAFYKKYGLPHDHQLANKGSKHLENNTKP